MAEPLHCIASIKVRLTGRASHGRARSWRGCMAVRPIQQSSFFQMAERVTLRTVSIIKNRAAGRSRGP